MKDVLKKIGPAIALAVVILLFVGLRPQTFASGDNAGLILLQTAVVGVAALGMTLIIISGGIDLSIGSNIALCTVVVAKLLQAGQPPIVAVLGGIATGALCGLVIGLLITRLKLSPFIVTLGTWGAYRGLAKGLANETTVDVTNKSYDLTPIKSLLTILPPERKWMIFPPGVWIAIVLAALVAWILRNTRFGRHIFAVGSNEATARLCGVNVERTKLGLYTLGAALAGVAGVLQFSYIGLGDPTTATGYELDAIAAVVIGGASLAGGQGSVLGTLLGATIMTVIANGGTKMDFPNWVQEIVTGAIIVLAVALDRLRHRGESA